MAVSTGLLQSMTREEVEAVIIHESRMSPTATLVTLTLIQGVVNTFVVFIPRIVGCVVDRLIPKNDKDAPGISCTRHHDRLMDLVLGVLASMIVAWFSRQRGSAPTPAQPA